MLLLSINCIAEGAVSGVQTVDAIPKPAAHMLAQPGSAKGNAATSRMDFDAVCRSLFQPEVQNTASWPLTVSCHLLLSFH